MELPSIPLRNLPINPSDLELRLDDVPYEISNTDVKERLAQLMDIKDDFFLVFERSSEDLFWRSISEPGIQVTQTARIIIPTDRATKLLNKKEFTIPHEGNEHIIKVSNIQQSKTSVGKFDELRKTRPLLRPAVEPTRDGPLGEIREVSLGCFDQGNTFAGTYTWGADRHPTFNMLCYFGDSWRKKFHVSLTESNPGDQFRREWMELHESNIRGIIFEEETEDNESGRVVYFVLDKAPQFYQQTVLDSQAPSRDTSDASGSFLGTHLEPDRAGDIAHEKIRSRISHPSFQGETICDKNLADSCNVAGIPWMIQYSRVVRVEYKKRYDFNLVSYAARLSQEQTENMILCQHPKIERSFSEMAQYALLVNNIESGLDDWKSSARRWICERLKRSAQAMETNHIRGLRRIHECVPEDCRRPQKLAGRVIESREALCEQLGGAAIKRDWPETDVFSLAVSFEIRVYPSHIELHGPTTQRSNSIIDKYQDKNDRFLSVRFLDNNEKPFRVEPGISPDHIIERVVQILLNETQLLLPAGQRFEFLGYSVSGLKKKRFWFFRLDANDLTAEQIRAGIGKWDVEDNLARKLAQSPSKWGARLGIAFSEAQNVVKLLPHEWHLRNDEEGLSSDGCGLISPELCEVINTKLRSSGHTVSQPLCFGAAKGIHRKIRFGGAKGVVYSGAKSLLRLPDQDKSDLKMLLRKSQIKFNVPTVGEITLRVASTTETSHSSLFSGPAIQALADSGANQEIIEKVFDNTYKDLMSLSRKTLGILQEICRISDDERPTPARHVLLKLAIRLQHNNILPKDYKDSFLALYLQKLARKARDKDLFQIPIPGSFQLLGLTDDYGILQHNEVYIRAKGNTISGPVLIYRDPIIHIGDIQEANGLCDNQVENSTLPESHKVALKAMDNVVFFSQKLDQKTCRRPFPNLLSGGDLDGDRFEILTKTCEFWGPEYSTSPPNDYTDESPPDPSKKDFDVQEPPNPSKKDFDVQELAAFIGQYIRNDCFVELQDLLMSLVDQKPTGMHHAHVKDLASYLSQAVDYPKSGVKVNLYDDVLSNEKFAAKGAPDFLRGVKRIYEPKDELYQSPHLLGRIYRKISRLTYGIPDSTNNADLKGAIHNQRQLEQRLPKFWTPGPPAVTGGRTRDERFSDSVFGELGHYRKYLESRNFTQRTEVDIFLQKPLDDFPESQLESLFQVVLRYLYEDGLIERVQATSGGSRLHYKLKQAWPKECVELAFKEYLFRAWEMSLEGIQVPASFEDGFGSGDSDPTGPPPGGSPGGGDSGGGDPDPTGPPTEDSPGGGGQEAVIRTLLVLHQGDLLVVVIQAAAIQIRRRLKSQTPHLQQCRHVQPAKHHIVPPVALIQGAPKLARRWYAKRSRHVA
ncbi:hypothetical protein JX265_012006 [Neoarthrinium moseri]|uniref:RNA-dependent RNA polymerase n=1 Tax=Neoarthrinium moseri TaxID=1658444 RepID=A0A9P9WAZ5_9PEZI|nr:hypothetical protein JX265_012006 [Neoarthrinium moseri]